MNSAIRWIGLSALVLVLSMLVISPLSTFVIRHFPENYAWQARQALRKGELESARFIAQKANNRQYYDFGAQRLLASIYLHEKNTTAAIHVLQTSINKTRAIVGRQVYSESYDLPGVLSLFIKALKADNQDVYAYEMQRWLHDLKRLHSPLSQSENPHQPVPFASSVDIDKIQWLPLNQFSTRSGTTASQTGSVQFKSNDVISGKFPIPVHAVSHIVVEVQGPQVMVIGPHIEVSCSGELLGVIYADSADTRLLEFPVTKSNTTGDLELTLNYLTGGLEPVTTTDRNTEILRIGYKSPNS